MSVLQACKERFNERCPWKHLAPIGASEADIRKLEEDLGLRLADAHREFLLWMGRDHAGILSDEQWYVDQIDSMTKWLPGLLRQNGIDPPQGNYVCVYNHQGYAMAWYLLPASTADPDIYLYCEGDERFPRPVIWGAFSDWIEHNLNTHSLDVLEQADARAEYEAMQETSMKDKAV